MAKTKSRPGLPQATRRYASPIKSYSPNITSGLGPLADTIYSTKSSPQEGTIVPSLEPESVGSENLAGSKWAILDKYFLRKFTLPILLTMIICFGIFVQDNGAGKLEDWKSILWTLEKCGVVTAICLFLMLIQWLLQKITKH